MSSYSYDVSVNTSTPSTDVGLPDRGVKSAAASLNPDAPSSDIVVDTNANWINAPIYQDVDLPTGNEVYLFDMNNSSCWPGTGATIFDLSGNGYNCEHAQLGLLYDDPAADTAINAPCSWKQQTGFSFTDDSTVLDYIDTGYNSELGTYLHINPDIENENVKYIRYPAPGTVYENYTFFMVAETYGVDDYEQSETLIPGEPVVDEDPDGDFTILGKTKGGVVMTRGGSGGDGNRGFRFHAPRTTNTFYYDFAPYYGINVKIYGRQYTVSHGTFGETANGPSGGRIRSPLRYFLDDDSLYSDVRNVLSDEFWTPDFEIRNNVDQIDNYIPGSQDQFARFDHTGIQVFSVTGEGNKSRTYLNGKYIGEMDLNRKMVDADALYWTVGIVQNGNNTVRACSGSQVKIYAWGLYDRTFTTEEHLQIHRKYLRHPNPTKEVEVRGIPSYSIFNTANDLGRPDTDIEIAFNAGAISSYDISLDLSSSSADVSVPPLPDLSV